MQPVGIYEDVVLKTVNQGKDTDTTAAVTGGLAGLLYGIDSTPEKVFGTTGMKN